MEKEVIINLGDYQTPGSKVFTGRDRGEQVRIASRIDDLAPSAEHVIINVPADIYSINPSFLEEFLVNVVSSSGKNGFMNKFGFISQGSYNIQRDVVEAVDRITRTENALV